MDEALIKKGLDILAENDPDVKAGLELVGYPDPRIRPHGFETLLRIIVGQQISTEAAAGILGRLDKAWPDKSPESFLAFNDEEMRGFGFSRRKVEYGRGVALAITEGRLDIEGLPTLADEAAIAELVKLKGIGAWSAEIYAMFSLGRTDVFPADDLALQEALRRLKKIEDRPKGKETRELIKHWSPWRSVGALFLWKYYRGAPK
ncbi:MAG: DNA-3-methyladenine glycosylase 2 family protein [Rhodospirillales bacterium]|nr:DNA-3-methyladenine glycosylase 2 family protein [Rhodospirillales bacterium]